MVENKFNWISYNDVKAILDGNDALLSNIVSEAEYNNLSKLKQIQKICEIYSVLKKQAEISFKRKSNASLYAQYSVNSQNQILADQVFKLGFNIVYGLRSFLFQEDIKVQEMILGSKNGKKDVPLGIYEVNMSDILKNKQFSISLNQGVVSLETALAKIGTDNLKKEHLEKWSDMLKFSGIENKSNFKPEKNDTFEYRNNIYQRFRNQADCKKVVFTINQKRINQKLSDITALDIESFTRLNFYYMTGENTFKRFNRGNLFEWFEDAIINSSVMRKKNGHNLFDAIMSDNKYQVEGIAGYKQGDYYNKNKEEQMWVQAKYGNSTLMQLNSINSVILGNKGTGNKKVKGILPILNEYLSGVDKNKKEATQKIKKDLLDLFTVGEDAINNGVTENLNMNKYLSEKNKQIAIQLNL